MRPYLSRFLVSAAAVAAPFVFAAGVGAGQRVHDTNVSQHRGAREEDGEIDALCVRRDRGIAVSVHLSAGAVRAASSADGGVVRPLTWVP